MSSLLTVRNIIGFTKPPRGTAVFFQTPMTVRKVDEKVATTTITDTTTETILASMTLPAVTLTSQGAAAMTVSGTFLNQSTATESIRLRGKIEIGGSTLTFAETTGITCSTSTSLRSWAFTAGLIGSTLSTELRSWSDITMSAPSTSLTPVSTSLYNGYGLVTVPNSSSQSIFTLSGQLSTASTDLTITANAGTLLQVN